jgi:hypothetical protein
MCFGVASHGFRSLVHTVKKRRVGANAVSSSRCAG